MKNKPKHIWLTFLLMTQEGTLLQSIPWTERDYGSNTAQKQRKRTVSEVNQKINCALKMSLEKRLLQSMIVRKTFSANQDLSDNTHRAFKGF